MMIIAMACYLLHWALRSPSVAAVSLLILSQICSRIIFFKSEQENCLQSCRIDLAVY